MVLRKEATSPGEPLPLLWWPFSGGRNHCSGVVMGSGSTMGFKAPGRLSGSMKPLDTDFLLQLMKSCSVCPDGSLVFVVLERGLGVPILTWSHTLKLPMGPGHGMSKASPLLPLHPGSGA